MLYYKDKNGREQYRYTAHKLATIAGNYYEFYCVHLFRPDIRQNDAWRNHLEEKSDFDMAMMFLLPRQRYFLRLWMKGETSTHELEQKGFYSPHRFAIDIFKQMTDYLNHNT